MTENNLIEELRGAVDSLPDSAAVVRWFMAQLGEVFDDGHFMVAFRTAFEVPLTTLYEALSWHGFANEGTMSDQDLDDLLRPWLFKPRNGAG